MKDFGPLRVSRTKHHSLYLSKHLSGCTRRNSNKRNAVISAFMFDFRWSLDSSLLVRTHFLKSGLLSSLFRFNWYLTVAQSGHTCKSKMVLQTKNLTCKLKMLLQMKNSTCKLKIVHCTISSLHVLYLICM